MDWYPWYPALYRADTLELTLEQDGAYRRLLDHYMETRLPLPDNNTALARIIGISINEFQAIAPQVKCKFKTKGDHLHNKRCDIELNRQDGLSKKRSNVAKAAHKKRNENKDKQAIAGQDPGNSGNTGQDRTRQTKEEDSCSVQADANDVPEGSPQNPSPEDTFQPDPKAARALVDEADKGGDEDLLDIPCFLDRRTPDQLAPGKFPTLKALGSGPARKYPAEFEKFWATFPKRATDTKAQAYTAWLKGVKAVGVDALQSAAEAYANFCAAKDHPSKLVATWISAEGWTAEYGAVGGGTSGEAQTPYQAALSGWYAAKEKAEAMGDQTPPRPQREDFVQ